MNRSEDLIVSFARARKGIVLCLSLALCALPGRSGAAAEAAGESPYGLWIEDMRSLDPEVWRRAEKLLVEAGPEMAPDLLRLTSPFLRLRVQGILLKLGPRKAVPVLIDLLEDPAVRSKAGGHLFTLIGPESSGEAERLLSCMRRIADASGYCGQALVKAMGPKAGAQVDLLVKAVGDKDAQVRVHAAGALGQIGPKAGKAVPALAAALKDPEAAVRRSAALALGRMRGKVREARKAVEEALAGPDEELRGEVEAALRDLDG